jgi:Ca-activated chloride channel homolog
MRSRGADQGMIRLLTWEADPEVLLVSAIGFIWPSMLFGLLVLPALVGIYVWLMRRRARVRVAFPRVDTLAAAMKRRPTVWRHLPAAMFLLGIAMLVVATARPVIPLRLLADQSAIMLSIDVSGSMLSQDVEPSRLQAAKNAAKAFVATLSRPVRVGLVTFAGYATVHMLPTTDHERLLAAIDAIGVRHRTAIGDGLMEAVAALPGRVRPLPDGTLPPLPPGPRPQGLVILLSDGQNNAGMDPLIAADLAGREEVTVHTVGIGVPMTENRFVIGGPLDEATLRAIARHTGGEYFHPTSGAALANVYKKLGRSVSWASQPVEATAIASAIAALIITISVTMGLLRHPLHG